jgi:hypothetical protein
MRFGVLWLAFELSVASLLSVSGLSADDRKTEEERKPVRKVAPRATPGVAGRGTTPVPAGREAATLGRSSVPATAGRVPAPAAVERGAVPGGAPRGPVSAARPAERVVRTANGGEIHRGPNGQLRVVQARGLVIQHGPAGSRVIVRERPGGVVVVSNRFGQGYVQRPYAYRGVQFVQRTYFINNVAYVGVYRPFVFGGVALAVYAPPVFFRPAFYGWAYNPWVVPVVYPWGWAGNPWFGYYGVYFTPYPAYPTPALWLTDYMMAQTLQAAYMQQAAALANAQAVAAQAPLTPDVKQAIADEVRRQIALENAEAAAGQAPPDPGSSGIARMLSDNMPHVFVVSAPLYLSSPAGECSVTEGDVLQLNPGTPPNVPAANLFVLASKGRDCRKGSLVTVGVADLQDMQNHMRETIDQGLSDLQRKQGQNGLPAAPPSAAPPPVPTAFASIAPPPDPNVAMELSQQTREANSAEREVLSQEATTGPATEPVATPPATTTLNISLGQSPDQVKAVLGDPKNIVDLGAKKIYVYSDLKVTFNNGKVTDVQ